MAALAAGLRDRYAFERPLGRGGMATVFLARDLKHDRPVALKVLLPELAASLGPERFQREIRLAARLQHPHILTVHDSGETAGQLWFTMPYVEGESLRDRLRRERQLPVEDAVRITREAAQALQYAHDRGVVHRDIKPENLLLTADGNTLVADFGIARALSGDEHLTQTGMSVGTPAYMSPEQAAGDKTLDARSDVYSLGTVLYEMLAGEAPFTGPTAQAIIAQRFSSAAPSVRKKRASVPEAVDQAVQKSLAMVPADRYPTAADFVRALQPASTVVTAPAETVATRARSPTTGTPILPRRRMPLAAITLALGFLIGLGVLFAWRRTHPSSDESAGPKVLAVLPFENVGDSATDYFADGVTDEVRGKLSALPGLQVIAGRSSGEYKRTTKGLPQIARELGADYVLVAKIRWEKVPGSPSRVRVSPELVDVTPGHAPRTRWQQGFDASLTDVFQVQADIAGRVAEALDVALGRAQKQTLAERPTGNLAAYEAYLKGEEASQGLALAHPPALRRAIEFYSQAVALDSAFVQAWVQLSRAHSSIYNVGTPTPADAEGAREAAERARRLAPERPEIQLALGDYQYFVRFDAPPAFAAYEVGLRSAPNDAELLSAIGRVEQSLGRWQASTERYAKANTVDPRSVLNARRQGIAELWLRRYPQADAAFERGLAISPTTLLLYSGKAMVRLAQGDLAGARDMIRSIPPQVAPTDVVANTATYWDLFWLLDDDQQRLLLRLPPSAFDDDRGAWGIAIAATHALRGDGAKAKAYADSAAAAFEQQIAASPENAQLYVLLGTALAYAGRRADAVRQGRLAVDKQPISRDAYQGAYIQHQLARIYILVGEPDKALDQLEALLKIPYYLSPGWLRVDPEFAPLKGNPRFERLIAGG